VTRSRVLKGAAMIRLRDVWVQPSSISEMYLQCSDDMCGTDRESDDPDAVWWVMVVMAHRTADGGFISHMGTYTLHTRAEAVAAADKLAREVHRQLSETNRGVSLSFATTP
jgi:ribosomal protein S16